MPETEQSDQPLSPKEAHALLASARPASVLAVLKHPDFSMVAALTFAGFRLDSQSYNSPLVRRRLADEASRNGEFAAKLRTVAAEPKPEAKPSPVKPSGIPVAASSAQESVGAASTEKYRVERDRLKSERDTESERRRTAEKELTSSRLAELAAAKAQTDAERELARAKQRADRLERKVRHLEIENAALRRVIGGKESSAAPVAPQTAGNDKSQSSPPPEDAFASAARHLLDKQKWGIAASIADDVLRGHPDNAEALDIRARALEGMGEVKDSLADRRKLVALGIASRDFAGAARALADLVSRASPPSAESKAARDFFAALTHAQADRTGVRDVFDRLKAGHSEAYQALKDAAQGDVATSLFARRSTGGPSPDSALPLTLANQPGRSITARMLIGWVNSNDSASIEAARRTMAGLGAEALTQIAESLLAASGGEGAFYRILSRQVLAGPAVVDASNVAWHGQEMLANPKPRLAQVIAVRRSLQDRGHFPVLLYADANLPFVVDEQAAMRRMVESGEIVLVPSGSDADEHILREARRLGAPVVSNDYMADWDPAQELPKLQFSISHTGIASLHEL